MSPRLVDYLASSILVTGERLALEHLASAGATVPQVEPSRILSNLGTRIAESIRQQTMPPTLRGTRLTDDAVIRAAMVRRLAQQCLHVCDSPEQVHWTFLRWLDDDFIPRLPVTPRTFEDPDSSDEHNGPSEQPGALAEEITMSLKSNELWKAVERSAKGLARVMRLHPAAGKLIHERLAAPAESDEPSFAHVVSSMIGIGMIGPNTRAKRGRREAQPTLAITTWIWTVEALRQPCGATQAQALAIWEFWFPDVTTKYNNARDCSRWHARVLTAYQDWDGQELQQHLRRQRREAKA